MLLALIRYIKGYLCVRVSGGSPERFLNLCRHHNIYLWGLRPRRRFYEMYIGIEGFRKLKPILKKTKTKVVIINRYGLPFFLHKYRKRKVFFAGAVGCVIFIYVLSTFVWNIHIEGNYSRTDETLLTFLETKDVRHGMRKSDLDCGQIVKDIRKEFDDIIWASASIEGTRLIIQVKENTDSIEQSEKKEEKATDIISSYDGEVVKIITRSGLPQVAVGDEVKKGDILVVGRVDIKNDAKEVVGYRYKEADADIYIRVREKYQNAIPISYEKKVYTKKKKRQLYLQTSEYILEAGSIKHDYKRFETDTKEMQLKLGEHFYFPLTIGLKTVKEYTLKKEKRTSFELRRLLSEDFNRFCMDLEKKGVEIIEKNVKIYNGQENAEARGMLTLLRKAEERKETERIQIEDKENPEKE